MAELNFTYDGAPFHNKSAGHKSTRCKELWKKWRWLPPTVGTTLYQGDDIPESAASHYERIQRDPTYRDQCQEQGTPEFMWYVHAKPKDGWARNSPYRHQRRDGFEFEFEDANYAIGDGPQFQWPDFDTFYKTRGSYIKDLVSLQKDENKPDEGWRPPPSLSKEANTLKPSKRPKARAKKKKKAEMPVLPKPKKSLEEDKPQPQWKNKSGSSSSWNTGNTWASGRWGSGYKTAAYHEFDAGHDARHYDKRGDRR
jgi:hypothetical protein